MSSDWSGGCEATAVMLRRQRQRTGRTLGGWGLGEPDTGHCHPKYYCSGHRDRGGKCGVSSLHSGLARQRQYHHQYHGLVLPKSHLEHNISHWVIGDIFKVVLCWHWNIIQNVKMCWLDGQIFEVASIFSIKCKSENYVLWIEIILTVFLMNDCFTSKRVHKKFYWRAFREQMISLR